MNAEEIPDWVPEPVRIVALGLPLKNDHLQRFLTRPEMLSVWSTLLKQSVTQSNIRAADDESQLIYALEGPPLTSFTTQSQACAILFRKVQITTQRVFEGSPVAPTRAFLREASKPYNDLSNGLEWLKGNSIFPIYPLEIDIMEAIELLSVYCKRKANFLMQDDSPYVLPKSSGDHEIDVIRSWTKGIAVTVKALWGGFMYGTLTKIMSVIFDIPRDDALEKNVTNWCNELPSQ